MTYFMVFQIRRLFPPFSICIDQCLFYAVITYHNLFIIVVLILLHLSYICHVIVCILSVYLSGTTM